MNTIAVAVFALVAGFLPVAALANPPEITWDWYKAGEAYLNYPNRTRRDVDLAIRYHTMAAEKGNAASAYKLGELHEGGIGVAKDYETALWWYQLSADYGDRYAEYRVGWFHQHGLGTRKDMKLTAYWYELSASHDNEWAYQSLAFMFADGDGVTKDVAKAKAYFEKSLPRTNDNWAQLKLATIIEKSDPKRAQNLLRQSAMAGNAEARKALAARGW